MKTGVKVGVIFAFVLFCASAYLLTNRGITAEGQPAPAPVNVPPAVTAAEPAEPKLDCAGCHGPGRSLPYLAGEKFHKEAHVAMDSSIHAKVAARGKSAANCMDCHSVNGDMATILAADDAKSTINRANIAQTCGKCHNDPALMAQKGITNRPFLAYQESVHGKALSHGNMKAAVCS
ncbi:MAG TPA: hypothetical protein PK108_07000, partial [Pyrinomonadaceae bacterium]|nr:hypothetical protein [Pyrinomonadaceae bacterium]